MVNLNEKKDDIPIRVERSNGANGPNGKNVEPCYTQDISRHTVYRDSARSSRPECITNEVRKIRNERCPIKKHSSFNTDNQQKPVPTLYTASDINKIINQYKTFLTENMVSKSRTIDLRKFHDVIENNEQLRLMI